MYILLWYITYMYSRLVETSVLSIEAIGTFSSLVNILSVLYPF